MKISKSAIVLAALFAGSIASASVIAKDASSPTLNCKAHHPCMNKELGSLERAINGQKMSVVEGQTIRARFFSNETELPSKETRVTILPGEEAHWSYVLAKAINDQHPELRAGFLHDNGEITPEETRPNAVYAQDGNIISHVEVSFN